MVLFQLCFCLFQVCVWQLQCFTRSFCCRIKNEFWFMTGVIFFRMDLQLRFACPWATWSTTPRHRTRVWKFKITKPPKWCAFRPHDRLQLEKSTLVMSVDENLMLAYVNAVAYIMLALIFRDSAMIWSYQNLLGFLNLLGSCAFWKAILLLVVNTNRDTLSRWHGFHSEFVQTRPRTIPTFRFL